jgi:hypothetical protein
MRCSSKYTIYRCLKLICFSVLLFILVPALRVLSVHAQRRGGDDTPVFREYRGVQIGMTAEEARKKLGTPKEKGDEQDFYVFDDSETAQVVYDKSHKVVTISADFLGGAKDVPTPKLVMGDDIQPKPDGSIYKMVRYEKAGFWVSYNRTAGASPMISITIQKID